MLDLDKLQFPYPLQYLGSFRDNRILFLKDNGEYDSILWSSEGAYIRENGIETYSVDIVSCNYKSYKVVKPLSFVFYQNQSYKYNIESIKNNAIAQISKIGIVKSYTNDKEAILRSEKMGEHLNEFIKIDFTVEYDYYGDCTDIICNC